MRYWHPIQCWWTAEYPQIPMSIRRQETCVLEFWCDHMKNHCAWLLGSCRGSFYVASHALRCPMIRGLESWSSIEQHVPHFLIRTKHLAFLVWRLTTSHEYYSAWCNQQFKVCGKGPQAKPRAPSNHSMCQAAGFKPPSQYLIMGCIIGLRPCRSSIQQHHLNGLYGQGLN